MNGVEANGPGVPPSAIKSVTINQNPYSALVARPGRARLELTTEGGTPQVHGSATFLFRDSAFDAKNHFADVKPAERRVYGYASVTGPLDRSARSTFLLGLELDPSDQQNVAFAATPDGIVNENVPFSAASRLLLLFSSSPDGLSATMARAISSGSSTRTSTALPTTSGLGAQCWPRPARIPEYPDV